MHQTRGAKWVIVEDDFLKTKPLIIRDVGPWDRFFTITNAAEQVVEELRAKGHLPDGRRLLYYDSEGNLDEILIKDGKFDEFKPYRKGEKDAG